MLTAHTVKLIKSLDKKKFRQKYLFFVAEGNKIIQEILHSRIEIEEIFATNPNDFVDSSQTVTQISERELQKISFLQNPKDSLALCRIPNDYTEINSAITLVLDGIQDPGNMGTIIRLADWFGIDQIICSEDTVDYLNPKVIQASMGSFTRVCMEYRNLHQYFAANNKPSIGTEMNGESIYSFEFPKAFNLVLGNEGNGIRAENFKYLQKSVSIPRFGNLQVTESLNVSVAAGIILGEIFSSN